MIIHRAYRDIQRCREKYGEAWKEYERRVPYLFIPVSELSDVDAMRILLTIVFSTSSNRFQLECMHQSVPFDHGAGPTSMNSGSECPSRDRFPTTSMRNPI
jgi:hypothetical protein